MPDHLTTEEIAARDAFLARHGARAVRVARVQPAPYIYNPAKDHLDPNPARAGATGTWKGGRQDAYRLAKAQAGKRARDAQICAALEDALSRGLTGHDALRDAAGVVLRSVDVIRRVAREHGVDLHFVQETELQRRARALDAQIVELVDGARDAHQIAELVGCSRDAVFERKKRLGLDIPARRSGRASSKIDEVAALADGTRDAIQIARIVGLSCGRVHQIKADLGLNIPDRMGGAGLVEMPVIIRSVAAVFDVSETDVAGHDRALHLPRVRDAAFWVARQARVAPRVAVMAMGGRCPKTSPMAVRRAVRRIAEDDGYRIACEEALPAALGALAEQILQECDNV